ncbi:MAG: hypothetical protein WC132_05535 [Methanomethylophilus sp.]
MARSRITNFIVNGSDYFTAHLDNGGVRVGLVNNTCYDLPPTHPRYAEAVAAADEAAVETLHDDLTGGYLRR